MIQLEGRNWVLTRNCVYQLPAGVVNKHGGQKCINRWHEFDMRSFVDDNPSMAWCTGPNCGRVVECKVDLEPHQQLDVRCNCGNVFCFNCKEEAHTPVGVTHDTYNS